MLCDYFAIWSEIKSEGDCCLSTLGPHVVTLKVLIVMNEVGLVPLVHLLTGLFHVLGQSRWSTAEYADFTHLTIKEEWTKKLQIFCNSPPCWIQILALVLYRGVDLLQ